MKKEKPSWLKSKGYIHLTAQIDVDKRFNEIIGKVSNPAYVSKYAFYPLIHSVIKERRYKKTGLSNGKRAHSFINSDGLSKRNIKERPLHYATHMDAIIFGYYAEMLQNLYEQEISSHHGLNHAIIAYRRIPVIEEETNKSTIHFASEVFEEVRDRAKRDEACAVLTFDIKSFFSSLDHKILKRAWGKLLGVEHLPNDHYNVFKASTRFSYILRDDLRIQSCGNNHRGEFNESRLALIRNQKGFNSFFESPEEFRNEIKKGNLKIHKYPFRNSAKEPIGIPQGLPISAILANLYLLSFDYTVFDTVVTKLGAFYRRYSDDIVFVCGLQQVEEIKTIVEDAIKESKVKISSDKTETFIFKNHSFGNTAPRLACFKQMPNANEVCAPFIYLGFEFNGKNVLIKSANLGKFYRRMISSIKRKAKRAIKIASQTPGAKPHIFRRQLYKLYTRSPLSKTKVFIRWKTFVKNDFGQFRLMTGEKEKTLKSNYLTYASRASEIMKEPAILNQLRKHKKIFNEAIHRHLKK